MTEVRRLQNLGILPPAEDLTWTEGATLRETLPKFEERSWITPYQSRLTLAGLDDQLRVGDYTILDRIGQSGMGQVFVSPGMKRRHTAIGLARRLEYRKASGAMCKVEAVMS